MLAIINIIFNNLLTLWDALSYHERRILITFEVGSNEILITRIRKKVKFCFVRLLDFPGACFPQENYHCYIQINKW